LTWFVGAFIDQPPTTKEIQMNDQSNLSSELIEELANLRREKRSLEQTPHMTHSKAMLLEMTIDRIEEITKAA
tara:strand:+ start:1294 stop:1512 length:219 start_codon:yes stop_codon:yes gene_type:complete